jgi:hypothetical protein
MSWLPMGCLQSCLSILKVACFSCAEQHREIRQHSLKTLVNNGGTGLPTLATCLPLGNLVLSGCCREGCR